MIRQGYEPNVEGLTYLPAPGALAVQLKDTTVRIDDLGDGARAALLTALVTIVLKKYCTSHRRAGKSPTPQRTGDVDGFHFRNSQKKPTTFHNNT